MDKVWKPSNPVCYTPSSEPYRIYLLQSTLHQIDVFWSYSLSPKYSNVVKSVVLTAVTIMSTSFRDVTLCSLLVIYWHFEEQTASISASGSKSKPSNKYAFCFLGLLFNPEDGGSIFLWIYVSLVSDYVASVPGNGVFIIKFFHFSKDSIPRKCFK
jgi:hypothetical protein